MSVRARFKLNSYTTQLWGKYNQETKETVEHEMRTLNFTPVSASEKNPENKKFWDATPSGSIQLGTINKSAWEEFQIGKEYNVDFTPVEE